MKFPGSLSCLLLINGNVSVPGFSGTGAVTDLYRFKNMGCPRVPLTPHPIFLVCIYTSVRQLQLHTSGRPWPL